MKKALVIALMLVLGLGLGTFAVSKITGEWSVALDINTYKWAGPGYYTIMDIFSMTSTLSVDYTVGGWVFGSETGFDAVHGYNSQAFTGTGDLGAFQFEATMNFMPNAVVKKSRHWYTQPDWRNPWFVYNSTCTSATACNVTTLTNTPLSHSAYRWDEENEPAFKDFTVSGGVSIAGVSFEALFMLNAWPGTTVYKRPIDWLISSAQIYDGVSLDNDYWANVVSCQSGSETFNPRVPVFMWSSADAIEIPGSTPIGSGFRFTIAGSVGGMTLTSYTYFNLSEADNLPDHDTGCAVLGKDGDPSVLSGCGLSFTEEYLMIENMPFVCGATIDAALKLVCPGVKDTVTCVCDQGTIAKEIPYDSQTCSYTIYYAKPKEPKVESAIVGFEYFTIALRGVDFLPGFWNLGVDLTFGTDSKSFALCGETTLADACFAIDMSLVGLGAATITGIQINSFSFDYVVNDTISVTSTTILNDPSPFGTYSKSLKTMSSEEVLPFLGPFYAKDSAGRLIQGPNYGDTNEFWALFKCYEDGNDDGLPDNLNDWWYNWDDYASLSAAEAAATVHGHALAEADDGVLYYYEATGNVGSDIVRLDYWETPKYKYYGWEKFDLHLTGPACCCTGVYTLDIDTYFGYEYEANPYFCACDGYYEDDSLPCCEDKIVNVGSWTKKPNYTQNTGANVVNLVTLFNWMATDISASLPLPVVGLTIDIGSEVSFRGWEKFSLGFTFSF